MLCQMIFLQLDLNTFSVTQAYVIIPVMQVQTLSHGLQMV